MEITPQIKECVVSALLADMRQREKSQADYAKFIAGQLNIPFDKAAFSQIKKADSRNAIKETSWLKLSKYFGVLDGGRLWQTAITATYRNIHTALDLCRENGIWQVLCDNAGLGKSYAAVDYARQYCKSVIYIDCSDCGTKSDFIMAFARHFGLERISTYNQLWRDIVAEILLMDHPLIILDEFGDVAEAVITLMKGLYNKADSGDRMEVGVYFIGANNLRVRLSRGRKQNKPSYAEFWSRFNNNITTLDFSEKTSDYVEQLKEDVTIIVDANLPVDLQEKRTIIIEKCAKTMGVRSIRKEIALQKRINNLNAV